MADEFTEFVEEVKVGVRAECATLDRDDSFMAKLILLSPHGTEDGQAVLFVELGPWLDTEELKDELGGVVMPALIRTWEATRVAWVTEAWTLYASDMGEWERWQRENPGKRVGDHPDRVECVQGWVADFTGTWTNICAPVTRGDSYELGEWMERLDGSSRNSFYDDDVGYLGRLQHDAMLALTGSPTSAEVQAGVKQLANDPEFQERMVRALVAGGVSPEVVDDPDSNIDVIAEAIRADPEFEEWMKARVKEVIGDVSPMRSRGTPDA